MFFHENSVSIMFEFKFNHQKNVVSKKVSYFRLLFFRQNSFIQPFLIGLLITEIYLNHDVTSYYLNYAYSMKTVYPLCLV